jgi:Ca2+-binding RTX toxin-like protein
MMMRKTVLLLAATALGVLVLAGGVALADNFTCNTDPCLGTNENDSIEGTNDAETIRALGGNDFVTAWRGKDLVYGGDGRDELDGHNGNDTIYGGPGADILYGASHSDTVYGGRGPDRIKADLYDSEPIGVHPVDHSYGQSGNDTIRAWDSFGDIINCGAGNEDTVVYDRRKDTIRNCENKRPSH